MNESTAAIEHVLAQVRVLVGRRRPKEAVNFLLKSLAEHPGHPALLFEKGIQHAALGDHGEAETCFRQILVELPLAAPARDHLARSLLALGSAGPAECEARRAVLTDPAAPAFTRRHADTVSAFSKPTSIPYYRRLLVQEPSSVAANLNVAEALSQTHGDDRAGRYYRKAMDLAPDAPQVRFNYAIHLLSRGHYREGWRHYEARLSPEMADAPERVLPVAPWTGEPLAGKTLLVCTEQGLGDEVRFAPYLSRLTEKAGTVIMETDPRMLEIYRRSVSGVVFHPFRRMRVRGRMRFTYDWLRGLPTPDFHAPLLSMPLLLEDDHRSPVSPAGFLQADPRRTEAVRATIADIGASGGPRVGLVWASGLINAVRASSYASLEHWRRLLDHPSAHFFAMQFGDIRSDLEALRALTDRPIHRLEYLDLRNDLEAVLALAANMDCVFASATATSVLAGAVGTPVIELAAVDNFIPDIDGTDALIGTIRRPRAGREGDWDTVFREAARLAGEILKP